MFKFFFSFQWIYSSYRTYISTNNFCFVLAFFFFFLVGKCKYCCYLRKQSGRYHIHDRHVRELFEENFTYGVTGLISLFTEVWSTAQFFFSGKHTCMCTIIVLVDKKNLTQHLKCFQCCFIGWWRGGSRVFCFLFSHRGVLPLKRYNDYLWYFLRM
jgi:hypothetical protein